MNGRIYVGQTINPKQRFNQHVIDLNKEKSKNKYLYRAMKKYGVENFKFEIIEPNIPIEEINDKEKYWIEKLKSRSPNGYNMTDGGEGTIGYRHTDETKVKMSDLKKGKFTHIQTEETRLKISKANKGKKPSEFARKRSKELKTGVPLSQETKNKLSQSLKGKKKSDGFLENTKKYWESISEDEKKLRIKSMIDARSIQICMIDPNTNTIIKSFDSMRIAAEWVRTNTDNAKASHTRISFVCGDTNKRAYGFIWDYK